MSTDGSTWSTLTSITDYTQSTYTVTGLSATTYYFRMYDKVGISGEFTSYSNSKILYQPLKIAINQPTTTSINIGQQIQLTTQTSGGTNSYKYQWYSNGSQLTGATSSTFNFNPTNVGTYYLKCTVSDAQESSLSPVTSSDIILVTTPLPTAQPTQQPTATPVPEFPSLVVLALFIVLSLFVAISVKKRKITKN